MLINIVGKTGSGKSLYNSYLAYTELTKIMNNGKTIPWWKFWSPGYSYYDKVVLNSDFNDGRGNYTKYVHIGEECKCPATRKDLKDVQKQNVYGVPITIKDHWEYAGHCIGISDLPEVYNERNCLVLLDEGGTQFSNRDWDKMPEGYLLFLTTHRHNVTHLPKQFDIILYTQQNDLVDITLRRLANHIFLIRPLFGFPKNPLKRRWYHKLPAIRIWTYHKHEVLQGRPRVVFNIDGVPVDNDPDDDLESLEHYSWFYFGKKYIRTYNTIGDVRELKRTKGL